MHLAPTCNQQALYSLRRRAMARLDLSMCRILDCMSFTDITRSTSLTTGFNSMVPIVGDWTETLANAGIPASADAYGGENWGGFVAASDINPSNWTRSYARSAYIDPLPPRPNLSILPNSTVTRIIFTNSSSGNLTASSVEYAATRDAARFTVNVTREVILSAGTVGSPRVLMHSGVGPSDVLAAADVPVVHALPGVGQHLQDHIVRYPFFLTQTTPLMI